MTMGDPNPGRKIYREVRHETKLVELYIKVWPSNELIKLKIPL